jgi:hypothetical protein
MRLRTTAAIGLLMLAAAPSAFGAYHEEVMEPTPAPGGGCVQVSGGSGTQSTDDSGMTGGSICVDSWFLKMVLAPVPVGGPTTPTSGVHTCLVRIESISRDSDGIVNDALLRDIGSPRCPRTPPEWEQEMFARLRNFIRGGCDGVGQLIRFTYTVSGGVPHSPRDFRCSAAPGGPVS